MTAGPMRKWEEHEIRDILTSFESNRALAARYGCGRNAISLIRLGRTHPHIATDVPRRSPKSRSCPGCVHWQQRSQRCGIGVPEVAIEGQLWARWCPSFLEGPVP